MTPAHQRLEPDDVAVAVLLRLVFEIQFAVRDRRFEIALQCAPIAQLLVHRRGKEADGAAAIVFRAIERGIGIRKQRPRVAAVARIHRDPDAEVELKGVAVDFDVGGERVAQSVGKQLGAGRQWIRRGDGDEFVAADAREKGALRRGLHPP